MRALCALRLQLLMAVHDSNAQHSKQTPFSFTQMGHQRPCWHQLLAGTHS